MSVWILVGRISVLSQHSTSTYTLMILYSICSLLSRPNETKLKGLLNATVANDTLWYNNYSIDLSKQSQGRKPRGISNVHAAIYNSTNSLIHDPSLCSTYTCTSFEWTLKNTLMNAVWMLKNRWGFVSFIYIYKKHG